MKLWFKTHMQPISYDFEPDKVNVVTGNSSTGKSSILRIIDYCLFSPECSIVEDVINHNVQWYGLIFHLDGHDYAVARKAPYNGIVSKDIYWKEDSNDFSDEYPHPTPNISRSELVQWMNKKFQIDGIGIKDKKTVYTLTFRHMMMMSYLTEEIIATLDTYFDTNFFGDRDYFRYLPNIVQVGVGLDSASVTDLEFMKQDLKRKIKKEGTKKNKDKSNEINYNKKLKEIAENANSLGIKIELQEECNENIILKSINEFVEEFNKIKRNKSKLKEIDILDAKLQDIRQKLRVLRSLKQEYNRSCAYAQLIKESVSPMKFLIGNLNIHTMSKETVMLYQSLEKSFKEIKNQNFEIDELPPSFQRDYESLKRNELEIVSKIRDLEKISNLVTNTEKLFSAFQIVNKLKELKRKPASYCGDVKLSEMHDNLRELECKLEMIKSQNIEVVKKLNQNIQVYFDIQGGISESYRNCEVYFDFDDAILKVRKKGEYADIKNVGSKSNFMFLHLCFFLGLHEFISSQKNVRVPNFLFIDQPSIPYYGHRERELLSINDNMQLSSKDDETKLKEAFKLIDSFMSQNINKENDQHFQIIMVEHADPEYWKDLPNFVTRYVFTEDKDYGLNT